MMTNFSKQKKVISISTNILQLLLACIALFVYYSLLLSYGIIDEADEILQYIDSRFVRTLMIVSISISIITLMGLPIRFHKKIHSWWRGKVFLVPKLLLLALLLCWIKFLPAIIDLCYVDIRLAAHTTGFYIFLISWFLLGFSLLHFYPPYMLQMRFIDYLKKKNWM